MQHAEYIIVAYTDDFVYIIDTGHKHTRTVTNDPDYVIQELYGQFNLEERRVSQIPPAKPGA
jgi:hypothetical protein